MVTIKEKLNPLKVYIKHKTDIFKNSVSWIFTDTYFRYMCTDFL